MVWRGWRYYNLSTLGAGQRVLNTSSNALIVVADLDHLKLIALTVMRLLSHQSYAELRMR